MFPQVTDNNYSSWEPVFTQQLEANCHNPLSYLNQISIIGDSVSRKIYSSLSSPSSVWQLTQAINHESYGSYIRARPEIIVFWVFALLIFILSIVISFLALKRCRSCFKYSPADRPRVSAKSVSKTGSFFLSVGGIALLIASLLLASLVAAYSSKVLAGTTGLRCDTLQTLNGYFFGSTKVATPENVLSDWRGSHAQFVAMSELRDSMNPTPVTGGRCALCQQIEAKFAELKTELLPLGNQNHEMSAKAAIMIEVFKNVVASCSRAKVEVPDKFEISNANAATAYNKGLQKSILDRSGAFSATLDKAMKMFQKNIDEMLGHSSQVLTNSHAAASTSLTGVADIDSVFAQIVKDWSKMSPVLLGFFTSAAGLSLAICILVFILAGVGLYMGMLILKSHRTDVPLNSVQTKGTGALFSIFAVVAGLTLVIAAYAFSMTVVVRDACDYAESEALAGNWQNLPKSLWQNTISNTTDMKSVMDTCIKEGGSGDVASALGVRMVLQQLQETLESTSDYLLGLLNKELDLKTKTETIAVLTNMMSSSSKMFGFPRCKLKVDKLFTASGQVSADFDFILNHLDQISPLEGDGRKSVLCLADAIMFDPSDIKTVIMTKCMNGLIETYETSTAAMKFLNDMAVEAMQKLNSTKGINSFCVPYLDHTDGCATVPDSVFKLVYTDSGSPLLSQRFLEFLEPFRGKEKKDYDMLKTILVTASTLTDYNAWLEKPFSDAVDLDTEIDTKVVNPRNLLPELFPEDQPLTFAFVLKAIDPKFDKCIDSTEKCTVMEALELWDMSMNSTATAVSETVLKGAEMIQHFVTVSTLGSFENELGKAFQALQNFDCQFVSTSLIEGPLYGLCEVVGPNLLSLSILCIFLSFVGACAALFTWRIFHYYHDLNNLGIKSDEVKHKISSTEHPTTAARAS